MDQYEEEDVASWAEQFYGLGRISGAAALQFLSQTGLAREVLKKIWELSDLNKDGQLDIVEFSLAMYFIGEHKIHAQLPSDGFSPEAALSVLKPLLVKHVRQPQSPPVTQQADETTYVVRQDEFEKWLAIFEAQAQGGLVGGEAAVNVFVQSGLARPELKAIYALCDLDRDGQLSLEEFIMAMKVCKDRYKGFEVPASVPPQLLDSTRQFTDQFKQEQPSDDSSGEVGAF